jgi:ABC-type glycerol-3-phosphate transport system substrate-binding protein
MLYKRVLSIILAVMLLLSVTACGGKIKTSSSGKSTSTKTVSSNTQASDASTQSGDTSSTVSGQSSGTGSGTTGSKSSSSKGTTSTTSTAPTNGTSLIKSGTKKMEEGLNFGGKTFTMACGITPTNLLKREITAFQTKYNCIIKYDMLDYDKYIQQAASKMASGKSYDILELEGHRFPSMVITNLCEPLENTITTADLINKSNVAAGGFSEDLSMAFSWKNHMYGVVGTTGYYGLNPVLLWYNKKLVKEAGAKDPRTLYNTGKWDYAAFTDLGTTLKKSNVWLCGRTLFKESFVASNGGWKVKNASGSTPAKANMLDPKVTNAYKYERTLTLGNNPVVNLNDTTEIDSFFQGKSAMYSSAPYNYSANASIAQNVVASNAFSKSLDNLGVVPLPKGPDNTNYAKPVTWLYALAAGKGSDKRVAVAWAKFGTTFKDPIKDTYALSDTDTKMISDVVNGNIIYFNSSYSDGTKLQNDYLAQMEWFIVEEGQDVTQLCTQTNVLLQNCINVQMKQ